MATFFRDLQRLTPATRVMVLALLCWPMPVMSYLNDVRILAWPIDVGGSVAFRDFGNLWLGGATAWSGDFGALFERSRYVVRLRETFGGEVRNLFWSYPPTAMVAFAPFALLPYGWACAAWTATGLTAYAAALWNRAMPNASGRVLLALAFTPGLFLCVTYGQTALVTSAILWFGFKHALGKPVLAGALLALFVVKPQMGLIIPAALIGIGAWRAVMTTGVLAGVALAAVVGLLGVEPWVLFQTYTIPQQILFTNQPVAGLTMMIGPYTLFYALGFAPPVAYAAQVLVTVVVMAALVLGLRRERNINLRFLMLALAALLVSPYVQTYELPLVALAVGRVLLDPEACARCGETAISLLAVGITLGLLLTVTVLVRLGVNLSCVILGCSFAWLVWSANHAPATRAPASPAG